MILHWLLKVPSFMKGVKGVNGLLSEESKRCLQLNQFKVQILTY